MMSFPTGTRFTREANTLSLPRRLYALFFLSLAQTVCAKLSIRIEEVEFTLGQNVTINWTGGKEPVSIQLLSKNAEGNFGEELGITTNEKGSGHFEWKTPTDLKPNAYSIVGFDTDGLAPSLPFEVQENDKTVSVQPFNIESADAPTPTSSSSSSHQPTQTTSPEPVSESPQGGLNASAKAGIGIGVSVSGLTMLLLATIFLLRRRRERTFDDEEALAPSLPAPFYAPSPRSLSPASPRPGTPVVSPLTPSRTPNRGHLFHFPRSLTPKLGKPFSWNALLSPAPGPRSPKPWGRDPVVSPLSEMEQRTVHVVGPLTELPAGDMDVEVPNRHEMPTKANTPELPGSPGGRNWGRERRVQFLE